MTTKEELAKEFERRENTGLVEVIKSVSITFDRNQLKALLKLRESMEQDLIKPGAMKLDGDRLTMLSLLNTILMDVENPNEIEAEWEGNKIMDNRLAKLRNKECARKEEAKAVEDDEELCHCTLSVFEYRMKDPKTRKFGRLVNEIELVLPANNNLSEEYINQEVDKQVEYLVREGDMLIVNSAHDRRTITLKKDKADWICEFGEVAIIQIKE